MNGFELCEIPTVLQIVYFIKTLINLVKFIVPIGLIIMVMLDFSKGVISGDTKPSEIIKASSNKFLAAIIIFVLPTIVDFSMGLVSDLTRYESCWANAEIDKIKQYQVLWDDAIEKKQEEEKIKEQAQKEEELENKENHPIISSITNDKVIITVNAKKANANIKGYYFSYNSQRPNKNTGGYLETNKQTIDVVRLPGTTYIWVEDTAGNISNYKTINISTDEVLVTTGKKYTILKGTALKTYLANRNWSIEELNNLIYRSVRAAGLYTKEAAATAALTLTQVLAQKYNIKIPYESAGIHKQPGAKDKWGATNSSSKGTSDKYYGLDCSSFVNWTYAGAGFGIESRAYFWGSMPRVEFSKDNGDVGDVLVYGKGQQSGRHVKLIIGKTNTAFITAEATGPGIVLDTYKFSNKNKYQIQKSINLTDLTKNKGYYYRTDYPSGF